MIWMFQSHRRATRVLTFTLALVTVTMILILGVRLHRLANLAASHRPHVSTAAALPDRPLDGGAITAGLSPSSAPPVFPDLGDPRPFAIDAVTSWIAGAPAGQISPAALEDLSAHAAPAGLAITGTARLTEPGPTAAQVSIPTNHGTLDVDMAAVNGAWSVQDLGWAAT